MAFTEAQAEDAAVRHPRISVSSDSGRSSERRWCPSKTRQPYRSALLKGSEGAAIPGTQRLRLLSLLMHRLGPSLAGY